MLNVLWRLKDAIKGLKLFSLTGDEIIIEADSTSEYAVRMAVVESSIGESLKVESFLLEKIKGTDGYVRLFPDGRADFKGLEPELWHQAAKYWCGLPITDDDMVFYHNGRLARFLSPMENPWAAEKPEDKERT